MKEEKKVQEYKQRMVDELAAKFKASPALFITNFSGLEVREVEKLRRALNKASSNYMVIKNSIGKLALTKSKLKVLTELLEGSVGVGLSSEDFVSTSKALVAFAKEHESFKIRGAFIEGEIYNAEKVKEVAALPSREMLIAQVVSQAKAPIYGFANALREVMRKFVSVVEQISKRKEDTDKHG